MQSRTLDTCIQRSIQARKTGLFAVLGTDGPAGGVADLGALRVTGADAANYLHSQLTNEVKALQPGEGNLSARVTRQGTLVRYFSLHALPDTAPGGYILLLEREGLPSLQSDLEKYAISDDVAFESVSEQFDWLALQGPQTPLVAEAVFGKLPGENWAELPEHAMRAVDIPGRPGESLWIFNRSLTGDTGYVAAIPRSSGALKPLLSKLAGAAMEHGVIFLEGAELAGTLEIMRIEAGLVRVGVDAPEGKLVLPETGLEQQVVSYSKGCYLGQEVIARIRTYGSVPHVLRGLILAAPGAAGAEGGVPPAAIEAWLAALERLPETGADLLTEDGRKVGQIVSRSVSPVLEAPVAFAYLDRASRTPGTQLKLKDTRGGTFSARVALLPFYKASDVKSRVAFLHDRAIRLFADEKDDRALALLEEALRLDPSFADGYEALGVILGRSGRFNEAIDIFKRLEEVAPNEPMVHTNLSLFYMKIGDKTAAEEEKAKATVKQFSRFGAMRVDEKRAAEEEAHKKTEAQRRKKMFEEVLEIDPEDPIALFGLGNALSALGDWTGAEQALGRTCAAQKDNSAAYLAHGKALEMLNREADAVRVYREGMAVASRKGDLMPLKEMERRVLLLAH